MTTQEVAWSKPMEKCNHSTTRATRPSCEQLLTDNYDRLYRFILRNTGHSSHARDLLQQTMAEAIKSYDNFRGESAPSTWLFGIARNIIRNYIYRSPSHRYHFVDDSHLEDMPTNELTPEETMVNKEYFSQIESAIDDLPPKLRIVLSMVALEEKSYEVVSAQLNISMGTVRSRLSRARAQLRRKLENNEVGTAAQLLKGKNGGKLYSRLRDDAS